LFEEYSEGASEVGVGAAFAGIEVVEAFSGEVELSDLIEGAGVVFAEGFGEGNVLAGSEGVQAICDARGEEVGEGTSHFVVVEGELGSPVHPDRVASDGFWLGEGEPVAVEVEPVVVGASAGPGFESFSVLGVGAGVLAAVVVGPVGEAVATVGVEVGDKDDDGVFEDVVNLVALAVGEVVEAPESGFADAGFVAVDAVAHPEDEGHAFNFGVGDFGGLSEEAAVGGFDFLDSGEIFGGGDDGVIQRLTLMGAGVREDLDARGDLLGNFLEVGRDFVAVEVPSPERASDRAHCNGGWGFF